MLKKNNWKSSLLFVVVASFIVSSVSFAASPTYTVTLISTPPTSVPTSGDNAGKIQLVYKITNLKSNKIPVTTFTLPPGATQGTTATLPNSTITSDLDVCATGGSFNVPANSSCALIINIDTTGLGTADAPEICINGSGCAIAMGANGATDTSITVQSVTAKAQSNTAGVNGFAYITNIGPSTNPVSLCSVNQSNGALFGCAATGNGFVSPGGITLNPDRSFAYAWESSTSFVNVCKVNKSSGALSNCGQAIATMFDASTGIAVNKDNSVAYVTSHDAPSGAVNSCVVNKADGKFSSCVTTGAGFYLPNAIALNQDNTVAFVTNSANPGGPSPSFLSSCNVTAGTGLFGCAPQLSVTFTGDPIGIALYKDGKYLYVSDSAGTVSVCSVSGKTVSGCTATAVSAPGGLSLSSDSTRLYVTDVIGDMVTVCTVSGNGGELSGCSSTGTGFVGPVGIVLSPAAPLFPTVTCRIGVINKTFMVAPKDNSAGIQWYNGEYVATGATSDTDGSANTDDIIAEQEDGGKSTYAASLCRNYRGGGFTDWYLPAKDELNCLYKNRETIKGFSDGGYWSSTEFAGVPQGNAWYQYFASGSGGDQYYGNKGGAFGVRCSRGFK